MFVHVSALGRCRVDIAHGGVSSIGLGLGLKTKITSLENWLNSFPMMIYFSSV